LLGWIDEMSTKINKLETSIDHMMSQTDADPSAKETQTLTERIVQSKNANPSLWFPSFSSLLE
jgi:hypothetical protein